jgi:AcrR family transcriptional regulator
MAGGRQQDAGDAATPRAELERLRDGRRQRREEERRTIGRAMLESCGEAGYRSASVQQAIERYGGNRSQFYRHFGGKAPCYQAAYAEEAAGLVEEMLAAGRSAPAWPAGLGAALSALADFVTGVPPLAKGVLVEVHVAGGEALLLRRALGDRLAAALDSARCQPGALPAPPELTARFMVGAVDTAAARALALGEPQAFPLQVGELARMILAAYFGEEMAAAELSGPAGAQWDGVQLRTTLPDIRKPSSKSRSPRTKKWPVGQEP